MQDILRLHQNIKEDSLQRKMQKYRIHYNTNETTNVN